MLAKIAEHFDSSLHAPVTELLEIGRHTHVDVPIGSRHIDVNGIEVIPTPRPLAGQHLLSRERRRGQLPVHRRHPSSAFQGDSAVHRIQPGSWKDCVDEALDGLAADSAGHYG
jgi:hypothetical protein